MSPAMRASSLESLKPREWQIQPLNVEWLGQIVQLEQQSFSSPWSKEVLLGELACRVAFVSGVVSGDRLLAYSFCRVVVDELHILNLAVDAEFRGRGIGSALLSHDILEAISRGVNYSILEVRRSNLAAQRLYLKFGFEFVGVRKHYYRDNREDALVYQRRLGPSDGSFFSEFLDITRVC